MKSCGNFLQGLILVLPLVEGQYAVGKDWHSDIVCLIVSPLEEAYPPLHVDFMLFISTFVLWRPCHPSFQSVHTPNHLPSNSSAT